MTLDQARIDERPGAASEARGAGVVVHALFFVLGFTVVFSFIGASVGLVGYVVQDARRWINLVAGVLLVAVRNPRHRHAPHHHLLASSSRPARPVAGSFSAGVQSDVPAGRDPLFRKARRLQADPSRHRLVVRDRDGIRSRLDALRWVLFWAEFFRRRSTRRKPPRRCSSSWLIRWVSASPS